MTSRINIRWNYYVSDNVNKNRKHIRFVKTIFRANLSSKAKKTVCILFSEVIVISALYKMIYLT